MKVETTVFAGDDLRRGAVIALESNLFIVGWRLRNEFYRITGGNARAGERIAICFVEDEAVSVILHTTQLMAFTKSSHRRKGYGSRCMTALNLGLVPEVRAEEGLPGTGGFWHKHGVLNKYYGTW